MTTATFDRPAETGLRSRTAKVLPRLPRRALIAGAAAALAMVAGAAWIAMPASSVSTDDAYVKADSTIVAPKIQGLVAQVLVRDNQAVKAGQPLVRIDPEDYRQAERAAAADVQGAEAAIAQQSAQKDLASANVDAALASIKAADAERARANANAARFSALEAEGDVSREQAEQMRATAATSRADSDRARASFAASEQQVTVIERTRAQLEASLARAEAALSLARQNLSHTVIRAPVSGIVGNRQVQRGEFVGVGTQMMTIVPMNTLYVTANFKETQTARMLIGQHASVTFDALPGYRFEGEVESFAPGSGSEFSLLPFEPATGNFTRIVQRVPVRIHLDPGQAGAERLRPGLSADVTVQLATH